MREVAIIGIGDTKFGELWDMSFREIGIQAGLAAVHDAKLSAEDIDALYVGNMSAGRFIEQEHVAALIADYSGMARDFMPATRVEAAGASGGLALRQGYMAVASGMHDIVVVGGAEKMTDVPDGLSNDIQNSAADRQWECTLRSDVPVPARHDRPQVHASVRRLARADRPGGGQEPQARFPQSESAVPEGDQPGDGAQGAHGGRTAWHVRLCAELGRRGRGGAVLHGEGAQVHRRSDQDTGLRAGVRYPGAARPSRHLHFPSDAGAAQRAFKQAKLEPKQVHLAEVHDNFTISELLAVEDLGFFAKGEGARATADGQTLIGGQVAVNTSGGLKARGDPIGATGVAQVVELVTQLRGAAGKRQVAGAKYGLAQNVGGTGGTVVVHILGVA